MDIKQYFDFENMQVYDFNNIDLQQEGNDNCYCDERCDNCDCNCDSCDSCDDCDYKIY